MFSFLSPRRKIAAGSFTREDLHGLWLPGLDGCVGHKRDALQLVGALYEAGFKSIHATPTIGPDHPGNTPQRIREAYEALLPEIRKRWPDLRTGYAASYALGPQFYALLKNPDFLTLPGERLLLRFSGSREPQDLSDLLFRVRIKGFKPLLLEPETLPYYSAQSTRLQRLKEKEMGFVVGLSSLAGLRGKAVQKSAENLMLDGMAEWTCSGIGDPGEGRLIQEIEMPIRLARLLESSPCRSL